MIFKKHMLNVEIAIIYFARKYPQGSYNMYIRFITSKDQIHNYCDNIDRLAMTRDNISFMIII